LTPEQLAKKRANGKSSFFFLLPLCVSLSPVSLSACLPPDLRLM
jgi:hypothetical protein